MPSASGPACGAAVTTTMIEAEAPLYRKGSTMDPIDVTVIEIAYDRRRLELAMNAVVDAQELCGRSEVIVQESKELLRQLDDTHPGGTEPLLRKNKYSA
jgi:hypothetical protein